MMVSVESVLLRGKRRMEKWMEVPFVRELEEGLLHLGGGFALSAFGVWGRMQPLTLGLIAGARGWRCLIAGAGAALGYHFFWPGEWLQGMAWVMGGTLLALVLPLLEQGRRLRWGMAAAAACLVSGVGLAFQLYGDGTGPDLFFLRLALGWVGAFAGGGMAMGDRLGSWMVGGAVVGGICAIQPLVGYVCAGAAMVTVPLPGAILAGLGADAAAPGQAAITTAACLAFFMMRLPVPCRRLLAPGLACGVLMLLRRQWEPMVLLPLCAGAAAGCLMPRYQAPVRSHGVGGAQVRLEQTAGILLALQRQLLESVSAAPDVEAMTEQLRRDTCEGCAARSGCLEQKRMTPALLTGEGEFLCRKSQQATEALRLRRLELRRLLAGRAQREEYRGAMVQQYGFLADTLRQIADGLPRQDPVPRPRFRIQVSARSRSRGQADGDRVTAFPGIACRYYVVLCDGMGTGLGAAEESRETSALIRRMLTAGLPPQSVLGSVNSQLTLTDRGGAVTVDLAEIRLDSGRVWIYKWGAGSSWLLGPRGCRQVGSPGPPPGLGIHAGREKASRASLSHGEVLVMISDGVRDAQAANWAILAGNMETGELARRILEDGSREEDDATAVVIRLVRKETDN